MFLQAMCLTALTLPLLGCCSQTRPRSDDSSVSYDLSNYKVPLTNGSDCNTFPAQCLPAPTSTLKAIALGNGTQNYSCPANPIPSALGATANLFDLSPILSRLNVIAGGPTSQANASLIETYISSVPKNFLAGEMSIEAKAPYQYGAQTKQFEARHPLLGTHFFSMDGIPTFALQTSLGVVQAKPANNILAPGKAGVPWLKLKSSGGNGAVTEVYRVYTAGGSPAVDVCDGKSDGYKFTVPYAALYWFYGPA